jgi:hypothetical protein
MTTTRIRPQGRTTPPPAVTLSHGALRLDRSGRVLYRLSPCGARLEARPAGLQRRSFFEEHLSARPADHLLGIYLEGVRRGRLYHFEDLDAVGTDGRALTLFLYFHAPTEQGWAFLEPRPVSDAA